MSKKTNNIEEFIDVIGARENNLKNINVKIPRSKYTVITGLSGSGKSSLALDTIYSEGLRRYIECLSTYTRQFLDRVDRPDLDDISGLPTAIAIESRNSVRNSRSTVGTTTEIYDYLRLLFSKIGKVFCPSCNSEINEDSPQSIYKYLISKYKNCRAIVTFPVEEKCSPKEYLAKGFSRAYIKRKSEDLELIQEFSANSEIIIDRLVIGEEDKSRIIESLENSFAESNKVLVHIDKGADYKFTKEFECTKCDIKFSKPVPTLFSFNSPHGACSECNGFGNILRIDPDLVIPNPDISISDGAIEPFTKPSYRFQLRKLKDFAERNNIDINTPFSRLNDDAKELIMNGDKTYRGVFGFFNRLERKNYKMHIRVFLSRYRSAFPCTICCGSRLTKDALWVRINKKNIDDLCNLPVGKLYQFISKLKLSKTEVEIAEDIIDEIKSRTNFLLKVGLDYLTLSRQTRSLSGGESQRVNLACQLGSRLTETLYVLDEPSIGLHPRDIDKLISIIKELRDRKNTVIVVEHDHEMIKAADHIIELGPEAGENGGSTIYQGNFRNFIKSKENSYTKLYLSGKKSIPIPNKRRKGNKKKLNIIGATENNLKNIDISIPLGTFTCVTGVSGSGKSSLLKDVIYSYLARKFRSEIESVGKFKKLEGIENISDSILLDQSPIGRTSRSNPATYIKVYDDIRKVISNTIQAKLKGFTPSHFSFNVKSGRCEVCKGEGRQRIEMLFLADVIVTCEECEGKRFKKEILNYKFKKKNINEILNLTIEEALLFFSDYHNICKKLKILNDVGLGYLRLGQSALTLSGGEAQRIKIARELGKKNGTNVLYILDEPTVGLHSEDIFKLLKVLNKLVDNGNSVVVIEHNLDVIKSADYVIDLGPEGGEKGGEIIAMGTPEDLIKFKNSHTAKFLKNILNIKPN